eukprot:1590136-Pleurochrysis_carterae.AAC.1
MNIRPAYKEDETTLRGKIHKAFQRWRKRVWHEYDVRAEGKEDGEGRKERERGRMELNIGVESGRYGEYICRSKPLKWVPRDPLGLHPRQRRYYHTIPYSK